MFELLSNGTVERLCKKMKNAGIKYGFGGVARLGEGMLPAESVIMEHYRLGSSRAILSRSFCNTEEFSGIDEIEKVFSKSMRMLREYESTLKETEETTLFDNANCIKQCVEKIVRRIQG